jgi:diaminohydroxyphosphoribosylaminopyrimidine deaminase/5-amino-6-(5-phosphoribosylamino)uracil reductase
MHEAFRNWQIQHPISAYTLDSPSYFMRLALEEAQKGWFAARPNPMVGCLLVDAHTHEILARGHHAIYGEAHAEVNALRAFYDKHPHQNASEVVGYVTLEPCSHTGKTPPCVEALIQAGIRKVVVGMVDVNPKVAGRGIQRLQEAGVEVDVFSETASADEASLITGNRLLNASFLWGFSHQRPYVALKIAQTLDAKIATRTGHSQWVSGETARAWVHEMRGGFDSILSTAQTVLADNAQLTVRTPSWDYTLQGGTPPRRIIVDRPFRFAEIQTHPLFETTHAETWLCVEADKVEQHPQACRRLENLGVKIFPFRFEAEDLTPFLETLFQAGVQSLWVEAGGRFSSALHRASLIDDYYIVIAPKCLGDSQALSAWVGGNPPPLRMEEASVWRLQQARVLGQDVLLHLSMDF